MNLYWVPRQPVYHRLNTLAMNHDHWNVTKSENGSMTKIKYSGKIFQITNIINKATFQKKNRRTPSREQKSAQLQGYSLEDCGYATT